jgi:hypothetical protein
MARPAASSVTAPRRRPKKRRSAASSIPAVIFALSVVATVISRYPPLAYNLAVHGTFRVLLASSFVLSGAAHFHAPMYKFYASMVPLPYKAFWIYSTGTAMIVSGLGLAFSWRSSLEIFTASLLRSRGILSSVVRCPWLSPDSHFSSHT